MEKTDYKELIILAIHVYKLAKYLLLYNRQFDPEFEKELRTKVEKESGESRAVDTYNQVKHVLKRDHRNLLSVFSIDSGDQVHDIDIAILTAQSPKKALK